LVVTTRTFASRVRAVAGFAGDHGPENGLGFEQAEEVRLDSGGYLLPVCVDAVHCELQILHTEFALMFAKLAAWSCLALGAVAALPPDPTICSLMIGWNGVASYVYCAGPCPVPPYQGQPCHMVGTTDQNGETADECYCAGKKVTTSCDKVYIVGHGALGALCNEWCPGTIDHCLATDLPPFQGPAWGPLQMCTGCP
jgi:hypothetical protein